MKKLIVIALFLCGSAIGQTIVVSPLPGHCVVGDLFDSYASHPAVCVATDKWVNLSKAIRSWEVDGNGEFAASLSQPWSPDCAYAFKDEQGGWHCPDETASGRVVGCVPCSGRHAKDQDCHEWFNRCQRRVEVMKNNITVDASSLTVAPDQVTDHTTNYHWACPSGFTMDFLGKHHDYDPPVCVKPKEQR